MSMITELSSAKLTPVFFVLVNTNDVDMGVGCSTLLSNTWHGREVGRVMMGLDPGYLLDWAAFEPQYETLEHGGVTSAVDAWYRVRQNDYEVPVELRSADDYQGMVELVKNAAGPGPINDVKPSNHE